MATFADDTAIIIANDCPNRAAIVTQRQLDLIQEWLDKWNIIGNIEKCKPVTFTLRKGNCPIVRLYDNNLPQAESVNYLGMNIDKRLTWKTHIKNKRKQADMKVRRMYWSLGPSSELSLENKLLLYKAIIKPVWTYGIQLWGTASTSNVEILQRFQNKVLRLITNAPWFITNNCIHKDLDMPLVTDEIKKYSNNYVSRLSNHVSVLAITLLDETDRVTRLKRKNALDLPYI